MLIIGHRGARGLASESSLESFKAALTAGVDAIECDVRVTRDGVAVVTHDSRIHDRGGKRRALSRLTYAQLQACRPDIMTLEAVIRFVNRRVPLYIEVKSGVSTAQVITILGECLRNGWTKDDFLLLSFSYKTLTVLRNGLPSIALIINDALLFRACYRAKRLGTKYVDVYSPLLTRWQVRWATRRGFVVFTFPHNNVVNAKRWEKVGLAGVITDYPERFITP